MEEEIALSVSWRCVRDLQCNQSFFDEENTAKLVQKITSEVDQLRSLAKHVVSKGLTGVTALVRSIELVLETVTCLINVFCHLGRVSLASLLL